MKAMVCEMCSGNDFLKDGELYVCQSCGTKYTPDAAKKLMIEGTVDIKGTVTVDNSQFVQKQLENARRAFAKEDWEEVEKYYNLVEQNTRNNMEAVFFSSFGKAMLALTDEEYYKREQKFNVLVNSMSVISDYYEDTTENKEWVLGFIEFAIEKMYSLTYVYKREAMYVAGIAQYYDSGVAGSPRWQRRLFDSVGNAYYTELCQIAEKHNEPYIQALINKTYALAGTQRQIALQQQKTVRRSNSINTVAILLLILFGGIVLAVLALAETGELEQLFS